MAGIIKAGDLTEQLGHQGQVYHFEDVTHRAQRCLNQAQQQAQRLLEQTRADADSVRRQAYEQGLHAARQQADQAASQQARQRLQSLIPAVQEAVARLDRARQNWLNHWENCAIELAIAIARCVIRREIRDEPQITRDLIRQALDLAAGQGDVTLHLHPDDHESLADDGQALIEALAGLGQVDIAADPTIELGGCRVETRFGVIDQQIEAQLARIRQELLD